MSDSELDDLAEFDHPPPPRCEICGATDDLRVARMMSPKRAPIVCTSCYIVWYERGLITAEAIRAYKAVTEPKE